MENMDKVQEKMHLNLSVFEGMVQKRIYSAFRLPAIVLIMLAVYGNTWWNSWVVNLVATIAAIVGICILEYRYGDLKEFKKKHGNVLKFLNVFNIFNKNKKFKQVSQRVITSPYSYPADQMSIEMNKLRGRDSFIGLLQSKFDINGKRVAILINAFKDNVIAIPDDNCPAAFVASKMAHACLLTLEITDDIADEDLTEKAISEYKDIVEKNLHYNWNIGVENKEVDDKLASEIVNNYTPETEEDTPIEVIEID